MYSGDREFEKVKTRLFLIDIVLRYTFVRFDSDFQLAAYKATAFYGNHSLFSSKETVYYGESQSTFYESIFCCDESQLIGCTATISYGEFQSAVYK